MTAEQRRLLAVLKRRDAPHTKTCSLDLSKSVHDCYRDGDFKRIGYQLIGGMMRPLGQCLYCHSLQVLDVFDEETP